MAEVKKNTGIRYKRWRINKDGSLMLWFDVEQLKAFIKELNQFFEDNPTSYGEIFIGFTNEPKKES